MKNVWTHLSPLQLGRYAEYYVKMAFVQAGFDVYAPEVDDRGIDVVVRRDPTRYLDVQVKSIRGATGYIFLAKEKFPPRPNLFAAVALFEEGRPPSLYLIPSQAFEKPNALLKSRDYGEGRKSKPEWGIDISRKSRPLLAAYDFDDVVKRI